MGGRRRGANRVRTPISTEKQPEYEERVAARRQRQLLCGFHRRYPRPVQQYTPETRLFGLQNLSK